MELQYLKVNTRSDAGKGAARKTRRNGKIPAILYGGENGDSVSITIDGPSFLQLLHGAQGEHSIVQLEIEDKPDLNGPVIIRDVQHHPVKAEILHADFMRIRLDEKIVTQVPIHLEGRPQGVVEGGLLDHQLRELEIECLALDVPEYVSVEVSHMEIGDSVHVSDIKLPEKVDLVTDPERAVAAVHAPRVVTAVLPEEIEAEEAAAAEAAEAEAAEAEGEGGGEEEEKGEE